MRDTYQLRETPVEGLWELARLIPRPLTPYMIKEGKTKRAYSIPDKRIKNLLDFLLPPLDPKHWSYVKYQYKNFSFSNPHQGSPGWHVDGMHHRRMMIMCIASDNDYAGTEFSRGGMKPFRTKVWRVYLARQATTHRSPEDCNQDNRYLFRFQIRMRESLQWEQLIGRYI